MPNVEDVWCSRSGKELFNAITRMGLLHEDGTRIYFSERVRITKHVIGILLESRYLPREFKDELPS
jgi:hypothetical protein